MSVVPPPNNYSPGTFNPANWRSNNTGSLTPQTGAEFFITYPQAQNSITLQNTNINGTINQGAYTLTTGGGVFTPSLTLSNSDLSPQPDIAYSKTFAGIAVQNSNFVVQSKDNNNATSILTGNTTAVSNPYKSIFRNSASGTNCGFVFQNAANTNLLTLDSAGNLTNAVSSSAYVTSASPAFTGVPTAPTASTGTNTTQLATTAFVLANAGTTPSTLQTNTINLGSNTAPTAQGNLNVYNGNGTASFNLICGTGGKAKFNSGVNVPAQTTLTDTTELVTYGYTSTNYAPLASPALTGTPTAPSPPTSDTSTKIATTEYVKSNLGSYAALASPALTGTPTAPTAAVGTNTTQLATTAFVLANGGGNPFSQVTISNSNSNSLAFQVNPTVSANSRLVTYLNPVAGGLLPQATSTDVLLMYLNTGDTAGLCIGTSSGSNPTNGLRIIKTGITLYSPIAYNTALSAYPLSNSNQLSTITYVNQAIASVSTSYTVPVSITVATLTSPALSITAPTTAVVNQSVFKLIQGISTDSGNNSQSAIEITSNIPTTGTTGGRFSVGVNSKYTAGNPYAPFQTQAGDTCLSYGVDATTAGLSIGKHDAVTASNGLRLTSTTITAYNPITLYNNWGSGTTPTSAANWTIKSSYNSNYYIATYGTTVSFTNPLPTAVELGTVSAVINMPNLNSLTPTGYSLMGVTSMFSDLTNTTITFRFVIYYFNSAGGTPTFPAIQYTWKLV